MGSTRPDPTLLSISTAVTKQHDHIKAEGREKPGREHVWAEEKDA